MMIERIKTIFNGDGLWARFLRSCSWVTIGSFSMQAIRMVRLWVLAWLLEPGMFGVLALLWSVLGLLKEISDTGFQHALIQNKRGEEQEFLNVAWLMNLGRNVLVIAAIFAVSGHLSLFGGAYVNETLPGLLRLSCLILVFEGLTSVSLVVLKKKMSFRPVMVVQVVGQLVGLIAAVGLGFWLRNALAVVISEIIASGVICVFSYVIYPGFWPSMKWARGAAKELFHFGMMTYFVAMVNALGMRVTVLYLGKLCNESELGLYGLSFTVVTAVSLLFSQLIITVGFPMLSQLQHDIEKVKKVTVEMVKATQVVVLPLFILLATFSEEIVLILPEKYALIGNVFRHLCVYGFLNVMIFQISPSFYAMNRLGWWLLRGIVHFVVLVACLRPLYMSYGLVGVCWAVNLGILASNLFIWLVYFKIFNWSLVDWFMKTAVFWQSIAVGGILGAGSYFSITLLIDNALEARWPVSVSIIVGVSGYLAISCWQYARTIYYKTPQKIR